MKQDTPEQWRPIPGYHHLYDVSDQGRIRSWRVRGQLLGTSPSPRILQQAPHIYGYGLVTLRRDGKAVSRSVHALVAEAFLGPRPPGGQVAHNDGDPTNNALANLRYDTAKGNALDRVTHDTHVRGERQPGHKLTVGQVRDIRSLYAAGDTSLSRLAAQYGVSKKLVLNIVHRRAWAWLDEATSTP